MPTPAVASERPVAALASRPFVGARQQQNSQRRFVLVPDLLVRVRVNFTIL